MADFSRETNYTENTSFSTVIFAKDSELLEVELNEVQEIFDTKMNRLALAYGDGFYPLDENDYYIFGSNPYSLTIKNGICLSKTGLSVRINNAKVIFSSLSSVSPYYVYAKMHLVDATKDSTIRDYGYDSANPIPNPIADNRVANETSRRRLVSYTVEYGGSVPSNTEEYSYVGIGIVTYDGTLHFTKITGTKENAYNAIQQTLINKAKLERINRLGFSVLDNVGYTITDKSDDWRDSYSVGNECLKEDSYCKYKFALSTIENLNFAYLLTFYCNILFDLKKADDPIYGNIPIDRKFRIEFSFDISSSFTGASSESFLGQGYKEFTLSDKDFNRIPFNYNLTYITSLHDDLEFVLRIQKLEYYDDTLGWTTCDTNALSPFLQDEPLNKSIRVVARPIGATFDNISPETFLDPITLNYNNLINKPSINSVTLAGNKTSADLHIQGGSGTSDYEELENLPTLDGVEIKGEFASDSYEMTAQDLTDMFDEIFTEDE